EIVVAIDKADPTRRGDLAGHLPGAHRRAPQAEALAVAVGTPELSRPRVRLAPGIDDAARFGVIEADAVVQRHALKRSDGAAKAERQRGHLADIAFRLRDPARVVFAQDVGSSDHVDVRPRRITIVGAEY